MAKLIKSECLNDFINQLINPLLQTMITIDYDEKSHNNLIISIMHIGYIKNFFVDGIYNKDGVELEFSQRFKNINLNDIKRISKNRYNVIVESNYEDFDYNLCNLDPSILVIKTKNDIDMDTTIISFDFNIKDKNKIYKVFEQIIRECNKCDKDFFKNTIKIV